MKKFNAVNKRNGRNFVLTFGEKITSFDIENNREREITQATVNRWYEIGEEIKPKAKKKNKPMERPSDQKDRRKKVTENIVREMRRKYDSGKHTVADLVREYGLSRRGTECIVYRITWKYVTDEEETKVA